MTTKPAAPLTEVAITLIRRGPKKEQILAHFNSSWDAFTLPMTKRRPLSPTARHVIGYLVAEQIIGAAK